MKKCFVPCCDNNESNSKKIFLRLPENNERCWQWFKAIGVRKPKDVIKPKKFCCEDHFDLEVDCTNWMRFRLIGEKLVLKSEVVPHLHLQQPLLDKQYSQMTESTRKRKAENLEEFRRQAKSAKRLFDEQPVCEEDIPSTSDIMPLCVSRTCDAAVQVTAMMQEAAVQVRCMMQDAEALTDICGGSESSESASAESVTNSEMTSSSSSVASTCSEEYIPDEDEDQNDDAILLKEIDRRTSTITLTEYRTRFYTGLPKETFFLVKLAENVGKIAYPDTLLTLRKLRFDDVYIRLADDFQRCINTVQKIFTKTVVVLGNFLSALIFWPEAAVIQKTLPIPFRARYKYVQSIIDAFEIEIVKPTNPTKQAITWSEYKKCNTVKFLISTTPNGFVNFISTAFAGRISDYELIKQSNYLAVLPDNSVVMADRGFKRLVPLLATKQCQLVRPPSVGSEERLSKADVKETKRIAALRIHVERIIRRLREFKMLVPHSCLRTSFLPLINHLLIIACAIINVQGPLIK